MIFVIQFLCQTMDLGTLNLHGCQFFPTIHVRHPLTDHLEDSFGRFDPDLNILEIQWDLKTQTL